MKNLINQILKVDNKADLALIIDAVKVARAAINRDRIAEAKAYFDVGDTVRFNGKAGVKKGVISKMKIKRAIVRCKNDQGETVLWDCPFTILEVA